MFDNCCFCFVFQCQVMVIVGGIQCIVGQVISDMYQQQWFIQVVVVWYVNVGYCLGQVFGQMEKYFWLQGIWQMLVLIIDIDFYVVGGKIVVQLRMIVVIDKYQLSGVQWQCQCIMLFSIERGFFIGDKVIVKQGIQWSVFLVFVFVCWQFKVQQLLQMLIGFWGMWVVLCFKQMVLLLQCVIVVW